MSAYNNKRVDDQHAWMMDNLSQLQSGWFAQGGPRFNTMSLSEYERFFAYVRQERELQKGQGT